MRPEMHVQVTSPSGFSDNNVIQRTSSGIAVHGYRENELALHLLAFVPFKCGKHSAPRLDPAPFY